MNFTWSCVTVRVEMVLICLVIRFFMGIPLYAHIICLHDIGFRHTHREHHPHTPTRTQVYLIILSTATLSLILAPLLWHLFLLRSSLRRPSLLLLARSVVRLPKTVSSLCRLSTTSSTKGHLPLDCLNN